MTQAFNLSQFANKVNTSGQADLTTAVSGLLPVANGGTGTASPSLVAGANIAVTGSFPNQTVAFSGTSGLTGFSTVIFGSSGTWTVPAGVTRARIWIIGGGGGGAYGSSTFYKSGGDGGSAVAYCTGISGTLTITIGAGGVGAGSAGGTGGGGTTSITGTGVSMSATGGAGAVYNVSNGATGAGTVTTGTALKVNAVTTSGANNYGRHPITTPIDNSGSTTTAAVSWSPSSATSAGMGGGLGTNSSSPNIAGCGGAVVIEY
jgi:hypothetical protein